jgi:hypothetical protein
MVHRFTFSVVPLQGALRSVERFARQELAGVEPGGGDADVDALDASAGWPPRQVDDRGGGCADAIGL